MCFKYFDNLNIDNHHNIALICSYLCMISYQEKVIQYKWLSEKFKFEKIISNEDYQTQYLTLYDTKNKIFFVVIRGTDIKRLRKQWKDVLYSCNFLPKKVENYKIHKGYYKKGEILKQSILPLIHKAYHDGYKVILTGHSLGGAISKYIGVLSNIECDIYTFGTPMLATKEFYEKGKVQNIYKYVNSGDLVPEFPSRIYDDGFHDFYELNNGECYLEKQKNIGFYIPFFYLLKIKILSNFLYALEEHSMKTYMHNLLKYVCNKDENLENK